MMFRKEQIASEAFEAAGVWDVNGDGVLDIISGSFWYQGPDFFVRHFIGPSQRVWEYYDDFSVLPIDLQGDGRMGYVTGGWWGANLRYRKPPLEGTENWEETVVAEGLTNVETTRFWDVDGDGVNHLVPNTPNGPFCTFKPVEGRLERRVIRQEPIGHGYGFGDIDGDGVGEFVFGGGYLKRTDGQWETVAAFQLDHYDASCPMIVADVDGDGLADVIVGHAHSHGLYWLDQQPDGSFTKRWIEKEGSQYHDLQWADIDGDGLPELVTGKRCRAHNGRDPGENEPASISVFKWGGEEFNRLVVDHVPLGGSGGGLGIQFALADLRGTGRLDIVAPGKDGLFVYWNEG